MHYFTLVHLSTNSSNLLYMGISIMSSQIHEIKRIKVSPVKDNSILAKTRYLPSNLRLRVVEHPQNIKPYGNFVLADDAQKLAVLKSKGSFFGGLSDDLIMEIVNLLDTPDLIHLMHTSRYFYGFVSFDQIWRDLYIKRLLQQEQGKSIRFSKWRGSWRNSVLGIDCQSKINCDVVYSDILYEQYQNSQVKYQDLFSNLIKEQEVLRQQKPLVMKNSAPLKSYYKGRIPRIDEETFTMEDYNTNWYNHPFILQSADKNRWPKWTTDYLQDKFSDVKFRQESVEWRLSRYMDYARNNNDEKPLYLFDCNSNATRELGKEFSPPPYAKDDLLKVLGESRPDHLWLTVGPTRSGSGFHKDPNSTCAWNAVLQGAKLWIMFPPDMLPPGIHTDESESEVTAPVDVAEWVLSGFYNDAVKISDQAYNNQGLSCVIGMTFPGDCMYVPAQWWHTVINFEDTVALTANFVPSVRLEEVLKFFKNKQDQVSGFHAKKFRKHLEEFIVHEGDTLDKNMHSKFEKFLNASNMKDTDEDVGELHTSTIDLPVFEFLVEKLRRTKYSERLEKALDAIRKEENKTKPSGRSQLWENLAKEKSNGFSFSFNLGVS